MSLLKRISWIPSVIVIVGLMVISSCKDDEKPKSGISFELADQDVNESDGTIEVKIILTSPLSEKAIVRFSVDGTAKEVDEDFEINPVGTLLEIDPGDTEFFISVELFEDLELEYDFTTEVDFETIILTLDEVVSGPAKLGDQLVHTINVFEDDVLIYLGWEGDTEDVDMDMFAWIDNPDTPEEDFGIFNPNYVGGVRRAKDYDYVLIPGGFPDGDYGFSYVYYSGTSTDLDFFAEVWNFGGTINGTVALPRIYEGHYTDENLNKWNDATTGTDPIIRQTGTKSGLNFTNFTAIDLTIPGTSRVKRLSGKIPLGTFEGTSIPKGRLKDIVDLY